MAARRATNKADGPTQWDLFEPWPEIATAPEPAAEPERPREFPARPYQQQAVEAVFASWEENNSCILIMCTAGGKTIVCGHVARRVLENSSRDVLFLAHRDELIRQAASKMRSMCGLHGVEIEKAEERSAIHGSVPRVVVASKDTLHKDARLKRFDRRRFAAIIIDECHRAAIDNRSYMNILDYFEGAKLLGVTATPDRTDGMALGRTFSSVAFTYDILDAINDGWIVPVVSALETVEGYDLSAVPKTASGDLSEERIAELMQTNPMLHAVASIATKYSNLDNGSPGQRPTLIFCASVTHARLVADLLNGWNARDGTGSAAAIWSQAKGVPAMPVETRRELMARFCRGEIRYLTNYGIATEGTDLPEVRIVLMARATASRALAAQMIGRGLRPHPSAVDRLNACEDAAGRRAIIRASLKPSCLVVDLVGNSGKHKLVTPFDILGGKFGPAVVAAAKAETARDKGSSEKTEPTDAMKALIAAKAALEAAESEQRKKVLMRAVTSTKFVNPFDVYDIPTGGREPGWLKGRKPTDAQIGMLEDAGVPRKKIARMSLFQASEMINKIMERRASGKCTLRQAATLAKYGESTEVTFEEARRLLDKIAANGWRPLR